MMGIKSTIQATLLADTALALITGVRIFIPDNLPKSGLAYYDGLRVNGFIPPTIVIAGKSDRNAFPIDRGGLQFLDIYFYQERGTSLLEQMRIHTKRVLHKCYHTPDDALLGMIHTMYIYSNPDGKIPEIADNVSFSFSRYSALYTRVGG